MITHQSDSWQLEDMDWDPATGLSTFQYSRRLPGSLGEIQTVVRLQPYQEDHVGWRDIWKAEPGEFLMKEIK